MQNYIRRKQRFPWLTVVAGCLVVGVLVFWLASREEMLEVRMPVDLAKNVPQIDVNIPPVFDTELAQVRNHLKQNTNSGKWEEVQFWPAVTNEEQYRADLQTMQKEAEKYRTLAQNERLNIAAMRARGVAVDYSPGDRQPLGGTRDEQALWQAKATLAEAETSLATYDLAIDRHKNEGILRIARLKYRTQNELGAMVLHDKLFFFRDGSIYAVYDAADSVGLQLAGLDNPFDDQL